ncbi:MAG: DUF4384 domain-containing protein [Proteobacteria bacterium]|nr:DUF4384 domain-containing protein [Pseudomonadota bacterium]
MSQGKRRLNIVSILPILVGSVFILAPNLYGAAGNLGDAAQMMVRGLSSKLKTSNLNITLGNITLKDSKYSSEFASNFMIYVESELVRHSDFKNIKKQKLMRTRSFKTFDDDDEEQPASSKEVTLEGSYRISGDTVFVSVSLIDADGGRVTEHEVGIKRSAIPWGLKPPNHQKIKASDKQIDRVPKKRNDFRIELEINKGGGAVYKEGEELKVYFRTEKDCYLKVLYIDVNQNRILMFPRQMDGAGLLGPGVDHALHGNNKYTIEPPFGSEMIMGFCSTEPIASKNEINLGGGFKGYDSQTSTETIVKGLRGLGVSDRNVQRAEARIYLTTVPRSKVCTRGLMVSLQSCSN